MKANTWASWANALPTLVLCWGAVGCGSAGPQEEVFEPVTEHGATLCSPRKEGEPPEVYYFARLNQRLADYPELASAITVPQVETCADARLFARDYLAYKAAHPEFDDFSISAEYRAWLENAPPPPALPAAESDAKSGDVPKIWHGIGGKKLPIVQLRTPATNAQGCSGTFISERWILTAAHCIPEANGTKNTNDRVRSFRGAITQLDGDGTPHDVGGRFSNLSLVGYPYPGYAGTLVANYTDYDVALVFINPDPNHDQALLEPDYGALPLSTVPVHAGQRMEVWGWGAFETNMFPDVLLGPGLDVKGTEVSGIVIPAFNYDKYVLPEQIRVFITDETTRICNGDSGGPLLAPVDGTDVIHAVTSARDWQAAAGNLCVQPVDFSYHSRVDTKAKRDWIESVMRFRDWYDNRHFSCRPSPVTPANDGYVQCWRKSCGLTSECAPGEVCRAPSLEEPKRCDSPLVGSP